MKTVAKLTLLITPLLLAACDSKLRFASVDTFEKSSVVMPVEDIPDVTVPPYDPPSNEEPPVVVDPPPVVVEPPPVIVEPPPVVVEPPPVIVKPPPVVVEPPPVIVKPPPVVVEPPPVIVDPPPVVVPPAPEPVYNKTSGTCANDSSTSVLSCLQCEVPPLPVVEPPMSLKARQLLHIMTQACGIFNKSYDRSYVTPAAAAHLAKLNRCSPTAYKDTNPTVQQADLLNRLTNNDTALYKKMFGGLWYQPPYSDNFEKYFGVEVREAVQVFCTQTNANFTGDLYPVEYYRNEDPLRFVMPPAYVKGNIYRSELKACLRESLNNPWRPTGPNPVQKVCTFETLSGESGAKINTQVSDWLTSGYKVGAEIKNQGLCLNVTQADQISSYQGEIIVGGYRCK